MQTYDKQYFVCVKVGTKYDSGWVNRLYTMLQRRTSRKFTLLCITDDARGIHQDVGIIDTQQFDEWQMLKQWWAKMYLFKIMKDFPLVYLDLDIVIQKDITPISEFAAFAPSNNIGTLLLKHSGLLPTDDSMMYPPILNSSVLVFPLGHNFTYVWDHFANDPDYYIHKYGSFDRFLSHEFPEIFIGISKEHYYFRIKAVNSEHEGHLISTCLENGSIVEYVYNPRKMLCILNTSGIGEMTNGYASKEMFLKGLEKYFL